MEGGKIMKFYGIINDEEISLNQIVLNCNLEEIQKLIIFLQIVKERHTFYLKDSDECHTHYKDWNKEWNRNIPDLVIVTIDEK